MNTWYRIEDHAVSNGVDEYGDPYPGHSMSLTLIPFRVLKETPQGVWLSAYDLCSKRWVKKDAHKRYACPSLAEAIESYKARKRKQLRIYQSRIKDVKECLFKIDHTAFKETEYSGNEESNFGFALSDSCLS